MDEDTKHKVDFLYSVVSSGIWGVFAAATLLGIMVVVSQCS